MFDIKKVQKEAEAEIREEMAKKAKDKIKAKLREIASAEKILANLRNEYEVLLREVGADA